jgi:hypothetical protein
VAESQSLMADRHSMTICHQPFAICYQLLRLPMQRVFPAARAKLLELDPVGIIPAILLGRVISFFAIRASHGDYRPNIFTLLSHFLNRLSRLI